MTHLYQKKDVCSVNFPRGALHTAVSVFEQLTVFDSLLRSKGDVCLSPSLLLVAVKGRVGLRRALNSAKVVFLCFCRVNYTAAPTEEVAKDEADD